MTKNRAHFLFHRQKFFALLVILTSSLGLADQVSAQSREYFQALNTVRANPSDPEASFIFARVAASEGDLTGAIAALERVLALNPELSNIRLELGVLYLETGATELGEAYIREALTAPNVPPEVRARAENYLATAEVRNRRYSFSVNVAAGLISDSNANSGPSTPDAGLGLGNVVAVGASDTSAYVFGQLEFRYDLGTQAGHEFAVDAALYSQRYNSFSVLDFDRYSLSAGIDLNLTRLLSMPAQLQARIAGDVAYRNNTRYLNEAGPSLAFRFLPDDRTDVTIATFWRDQNFKPPVSTDQRDGSYYGLRISAKRALSPGLDVRGSVLYAKKTAEVQFEAYDQFVAVLGIDKEIFVGEDNSNGPWIGSLNGYYSHIDYEADDPRITAIGFPAVGGRAEDLLTVSASLKIPFAQNYGLLTEVGYTRQDSDVGLFEFNNTFASVSLTFDF
ncbi:tetratricopeptide repeat protein [Sedimentitalea nanhaiensis]|uniref:Tetratricopeptide repeat-containing protein n=1 Tax=Sedimentitalea nanhaiensis TaxID=999627 RepID=A0A1I7EBC9_9RHOB|nr:tetratricopeptide repeat protein [Sedimentitalea nanhaiensis]SFU21260.1 Tetratricopeptide repeat-containing protein [Sedimentitalea nanhaiensis]